ncbi:hypothetical protein [Chryseobacterium gregarium]|nr:hypothetical protein [Chryseobacterium gregarium]
MKLPTELGDTYINTVLLNLSLKDLSHDMSSGSLLKGLRTMQFPITDG